MRKRLLLPFCVFLSSCAGGFSFSSYAPGEISTRYREVSGEGYSTLSSFTPLESQEGTLPTSFSSVYNDGSRFAIPSLGRQKLLVIPVDFEETPGNSSEIERLSQAFFGKNPSNSFPSLAEYFDVSSYSHFQVEGGVASSWFRSKRYSFSDLSSLYGSTRNQKALGEIYQEALEWYDETHPEHPSSEFAYEDGHGHAVVPAFLVYHAPYSQTNRSSMLWAFSASSPAPISWVPYSMIAEGDRIDSRTIVHEMGHLLGFPDLYDTSDPSSSGRISPVGHSDMMDGSLGDENPLFKLLMGWTKPIVAYGNGEVSLHQFVTSGDCLLLKKNYSGSLYDEYVLLDFYTPSSLNGYDANRRNDTLRLSRKSGIRVYRVDARLGVFQEGSSSPSGLLTPQTETSGMRLDFYAQNGSGYEANGFIEGSSPFLQYLDASSNSARLRSFYWAGDQNKDLSEKEGGYHSRDVLFQKGQGFHDGAFSDLSFSNGDGLGISWKVEEVGSTHARVSFWGF